MPIGIVNDKDFEREVNKLEGKTVPGGIIQDKPTRGRDNGDINVPESLRKIIGETAVIEGRQEALQLAKEFDISPSSVSAYTKGSTSTSSYDTPNQGILAHINKSRYRAIKRAGLTLNQALSAISQDKLDNTDAKDLASIAKDMSVVIKNMEPTRDSPGLDQSNNTPQFVIFAPQFRQENTFESVKVEE